MEKAVRDRGVFKAGIVFLLFCLFMVLLAQPSSAHAAFAQDLGAYFDQDTWDPGYEGDNETAAYSGDTDYIPDPDSALERIDREIGEMEGDSGGGWWEWLIPGYNVYKAGKTVLGAVGTGLKKIVGAVWNSIFFFVLMNTLTGLHWVLELLVPEINSRIEFLGRSSVLESGAHVDGGDAETIIDWPGSDFNYSPNVTDYSGIPTDLPAVVPSTNAAYEVKNAGYITGNFKTVRAIALWLVLILLVIASLKAIAGSVSGYGLYTAKSIIPRCIFAVIGGYFSLWICQLILDINWAMSFDVVGSSSILTDPLQGFYEKLITQASMGSSFVLLLATIVLIVMLCILFIMYHLRYAIILMLAVLSPIAMTCYILDDTQYITFTWLKSYVAIVFLQFIHVVILAVFESTMFAGMDVLSNCLISLSMVYLMLKLPGWLLRGATVGGASGGAVAGAYMAGRGASRAISAGRSAAAAAA